MNLVEEDLNDKPITKQQLKIIENALDKLFSDLGIDIVFTNHFFDRLNDSRNLTQITPFELAKIYKSVHDKYGAKIAADKSHEEIEEMIKSISTQINIPIIIQHDRTGNHLEIVAKTIMRKKDFKTSTPILKVESLSFKDYLRQL